MEPILKVEHVSKAFGKGEAYLKVLDDVSLEIHKGEFASLMGPSGSGKSTLLYIIGGLDIEYEGNIYISGQKMTGMKDEEQSALRLAKIGFIFQFYNLVQNLSVENNILLPIKMAGKQVENYQEKLEDGEISFGKIKRGNRELFITSKLGEQKAYLIPLTKQILVQEGDYVRAGHALSDGAITPEDILAIQGPTAVQDYIVNEAQAVYRMQGVEINDKHFEIIVRQMMRKVEILEAGDTRFLEGDIVDKLDFLEENDRIWGRKVVTDAGESENLHEGQIVTARRLHDENSSLRRRDKKLVKARDAECATAKQILQGITRAALGTKSFMSAASFQETTKVLNEAAIRGKVDTLEGMKENVICGNLIPAGTGMRDFQKITVHNQEEYAAIQAAREAAEAALNGDE